MDYKVLNKHLYDRCAEKFEKRTEDYLSDNTLKKDICLFVSSLTGKDILDLGSGPGRDALFFKRRGLNPLCIDISSEMIKLCKQKGLNAQVGDLEDLPFDDNSFDGVWACASLLQMPKSKMPLVLKNIRRILKLEGKFYIRMKEGNFDGLIEDDKYSGDKRFIALYSDKELKTLLSKQFKIVHSSRVKLEDAPFLNYLCENVK